MRILHQHSGQINEVHMEQGPIGRTLLLFAWPILLSQLLQQMYSLADCIIVGHYAGDGGLAAVGEVSLLLSVIINFFVGFSSSISGITGAAFGSRNNGKLSRVIHAVMGMSLLLGAIMTLGGIFWGRQALLSISCPAEILDLAEIYLQICMLGIIPQLVYNCGNFILSSLGNTKEPLYFLIFSSLVNVVLDFLFVAVLPWGLPGAGAATVISQWLLGFIMVWKLMGLDQAYRFNLRNIFTGQGELPQIIRTGLPSGMQAIFMSISSLVIQYSINAFGADAAAGMVVFARAESFLYYPAFSFGMALTSFAGQNYGAGKLQRVLDSRKISLRYLTLFTAITSGVLILGAPTLLGIFTPDAAIAENGRQAILCIFPFYFLYALNQVYMGWLKGLGKTAFPMLCALICYCIFRVVWCQALLPFIWDIRVIYFSYDASWILMLALLILRCRREDKQLLPTPQPKAFSLSLALAKTFTLISK